MANRYSQWQMYSKTPSLYLYSNEVAAFNVLRFQLKIISIYAKHIKKHYEIDLDYQVQKTQTVLLQIQISI